MAFPWLPPIYNVSGREQQWVNSIVNMHDTFCGCTGPFYHLMYILQKKGGFNQLTTKEENQIKKCLSIHSGDCTDAATTTEPADGGPEGDIDFGDLDALFSENGTGEDLDG